MEIGPCDYALQQLRHLERERHNIDMKYLSNEGCNQTCSVISKPPIERVLGEGLSAVVKEAFEKNPQQQVAIKMIKKEKWPRDNSDPDNTK